MRKGKKFKTLIVAAVIGVTTLLTNPILCEAAEDGFVTAEDGKFKLDGSDFYYSGTNCYYLNFKPAEDVDTLLEEASDMGLSVIRTWGHLDVGTMTDQVDEEGVPVFEGSIDGGAKEGVYYQYFDAEKNEPVVNEGEMGLQKMDYVLAKAQEEDIKILLTFTNNWTPFGGMKQYLSWAGVDDQDAFYTNEKIKGWYKNYIKTMLNHVNVYTGVAYKDDPTIFAWELANEPRSTDNLATKGTVYDWAKEMSEYVKSIDSNHMVSVGDEGCLRYDSNNKEDMQMLEDLGVNFNWTNWGGGMGTDFERMLSIETIDFATPHLYLKDWSFSETDAKAWLKLHGEIAQEYNKPIILEEFGWKKEDAGTAFDSKDDLFEVVYDIIEGEGEYAYSGVSYQGDNYWMIATHMIADGKIYPDYDGFTVWSCPGQETESVRQQIIEHAAYMNQKGDKNKIDVKEVKVDLANLEDAKINLTLQTGAELKSVDLLGDSLVEGKHYTFDGSVVTLKKEFLENLPERKYDLTFTTSLGVKPEAVLRVVNSSVESAVVLEESFIFDKNPKIVKDIVVPFNLNDGGSVENVTLLKKNYRMGLNENEDYVVEEGKLVIKANYLMSIEEKEVEFELDFKYGDSPTITVKIQNTEGADILDDFEQYTTDTEVSDAWVQNNGGGDITRTIVTDKSDSKALAYQYEYEGRWWAGITKNLSNLDLSKYTGIQMWYQPDGSNNKMTIQLRDTGDVYWEAYVVLDSTDAQLIQIPFSEFEIKQGNKTGEMGEQRFNAIGIYINNNSGSTSTNGTIYFDNIEAYTTESPDIEIIPVEGITLDQTSKELKVGESFTLAYTITPENATYKTVTWSSSDEEVATVADGVIVAKKAGKATITVKSNAGSFTASCEVTVNGDIMSGDSDTDIELGENDIDIGEFGTEEITTEDTTEFVTTESNTEATTKEPVTEVRTEETTSTLTTETRTEATTKESTTEVRTEGTTKELTTETKTEATTRELTTEEKTEATTKESTTEVRTEGTTKELTTETRTEKLTTELTTETRTEKLTTELTTETRTEKLTTELTTERGTEKLTTERTTATRTEESTKELTTATRTEENTKELTTENRTEEATKEGTTATRTEGTTQTTSTEEKNTITSVSVIPGTTTLTIGSYITLGAIVEPATADQKVIWSSSNTEVAVVDTNGKVIAKKAGSAIIQATSADGKQYGECVIIVTSETEKEVSVEGVELNLETLELAVGVKAVLQASITPVDATNQEIIWSTSDASVAEVDTVTGVITAVNKGTAVVTVTTLDGTKKATCKVTVKENQSSEIAVTNISLNEKEVVMKSGEKKQLTVAIEPANATNQEVSYMSSDSNVATISASGEITAKKEGTSVITVTSKDGGKTAYCLVKVESEQTEDTVAVEKVTLKQSTLELTIGESETFSVNITPENATNKKLIWTSTDEKVAKVDSNGKVTALTEGATTITVQAEDGGIPAFCTVTVKEKEVPVTTIEVKDISVNLSSVTLALNKTKTVKATVVPSNATNKKITYTSSNSSVATVSSTGTVKAVAPGVATIKVKAGSVEKKVTIKVKPAKVTSLTKKKLSKTKIRLSWKKQSKVTGYKIYRYNAKTGNYKLYKITKKNYISVANLKKNVTYKFKVKAYKKSGSVVVNGDYSKVYTIKIK